jgi:alkylated DNA nucleotide flippase Atl1
MDREEYVEAVLRIVESIPPGRVTTYGTIAEAVGTGGPRSVGRVMSLYGGPVPWWRVVRADGTLPQSHGPEALECYRAEGTPLTRRQRPDLTRAYWWPGQEPGARPGRSRPAE